MTIRLIRLRNQDGLMTELVRLGLGGRGSGRVEGGGGDRRASGRRVERGARARPFRSDMNMTVFIGPGSGHGPRRDYCGRRCNARARARSLASVPALQRPRGSGCLQFWRCKHGDNLETIWHPYWPILNHQMALPVF